MSYVLHGAERILRVRLDDLLDPIAPAGRQTRKIFPLKVNSSKMAVTAIKFSPT